MRLTGMLATRATESSSLARDISMAFMSMSTYLEMTFTMSFLMFSIISGEMFILSCTSTTFRRLRATLPDGSFLPKIFINASIISKPPPLKD